MNRAQLNTDTDETVFTGAAAKAITMNPYLKRLIANTLNIDDNAIINDLITGGALKIASAETVKYLNQKRLEMLASIASRPTMAALEELEGNLLYEIELSANNIKDGVALEGNTLKKLYTSIQGIQSILSSDNVDMDTVQEIVNFIEEIQVRLDTILVNNLVDGGTTKALTAEQGKILKNLVDDKASIGDLEAITTYLEDEIVNAKDELKDSVPGVGNTLNKIYNLLQLRPSVPIKLNTSISHSGSTSEDKIFSILIPANTFQADDYLEFFSTINSTNNANAKTVRAYFNTSDNLSGSPILWGTRILAQAATQPFGRGMFFKNSKTSQQTLVGTTLNASIDYTGTTGTAATLSIDFTIDQYFIISGQLAVGTDTITINGITSLIRR